MQTSSLMHKPCMKPGTAQHPIRPLTGRRSLKPVAASRQHDALAPLKMAGAALATSLMLLVSLPEKQPSVWFFDMCRLPAVMQRTTQALHVQHLKTCSVLTPRA